MTRPVELVPLNCLRCSMPIPAQENEVAWLCSTCGASMALSDTGELIPCEINFSANLSPNQKGSPFWVAEGKVELVRQSYNRVGNSDREAVSFWAQPRRFFIPAYDCDLEEMLASGIRLLKEPPALQNGPKTDFLPITQSASDVRPFAEFLIIALEASRRDKVKSVQFELELGVLALWILP